MVIESATNAHEYEAVPVDPDSPIARDMDFDRSESHVYVMSEKKVSHLFPWLLLRYYYFVPGGLKFVCYLNVVKLGTGVPAYFGPG